MARAKKETKGTLIKAYKVTASGSYKGVGKGEVMDYEVTGVVPYHPEEEKVIAAVRNRMVEMWLNQREGNTVRVDAVREVYIDELEETEAEFSFIGKDVRELDYEEMQYVAILKDVREIPLYKAGGLRECQIKTYAAYAKEVLKTKIDISKADFNLSKQNPIRVDSDYKVSERKARTVEEAVKETFEAEIL